MCGGLCISTAAYCTGFTKPRPLLSNPITSVGFDLNRLTVKPRHCILFYPELRQITEAKAISPHFKHDLNPTFYAHAASCTRLIVATDKDISVKSEVRR